jgi:hypothetical protein
MAMRPVCSCKPERGTSDAERIDPCLRWVDSKSESDGAVGTLINAEPVALGAQRSTYLRQGRHRPRSSLPATDVMRHEKIFQVFVSHLPYALW